MRTLFVVASIALSTAAAGVYAQTPASSSGTKVTAIGCIEPSSAETAVGTSGTSGAIAPDTKFVLVTPSVASSATASKEGTPTKSNLAYRLDDADQAKVSPHKGHKVEITGTVANQQPTSAAGETAHTSSVAPKLKVESVRMIASKCSSR